MSCLCRYLSTVPAPGDGEVVILSKILQVLNDGGGSGLGGVTSISVDGGPAQTGAVSITTGGSALLNFTDENANADGVMWGNAGTTEILRSVGATGNLQTTAARIHRDVDNSALAFIGGVGKSTASFFEMSGQSAASPGFALVTTKGQTLGTGTFRILNAPNSSTVSSTRAEMVWEGNWSFTPTWNAGATTFTGLNLNVTNTASAAASLLMNLQSSSTSRFVVEATGDVGIGTSTPAANGIGGTPTVLQVHNMGSSVAAMLLSNASTAAGAVPGIFNFVSTGLSAIDKRLAEIYAVKEDALTVNPVGSLLFTTANGGSPTVKVKITNTGDVGIGTETPGSKLSVVGANGTLTGISLSNGVAGAAAAITASRYIGLTNGAVPSIAINTGFSGIEFGPPGGTGEGYLAFHTHDDGVESGERMRIDKSGNVGIGTTVPQNKLSIMTSAAVYESLTDASNYSRLLFSTPAGNHLVQTQAIGTGTLRILQVGTGPSAGANIAGVNAIAHGGQSTGSAVGGSYLIQVSPAGGAGSGVNALSTVLTQSTTDLTQALAIRFAVASGANQRAGNATLVAGTVTVSNTTVTGNTIVMLTRKTSGGTIGTAITYTVSASTSFTINSDNILDTSSFSYFLIEVP